jgi:putative RecB family exonuclease
MTPPPYSAEIVLAPLPTSLSPSRISTFTECPRRFQYTAIERLEEPPSPWTLKGTLVHAALEGLFCRAPLERTMDAALGALDDAASQDWFLEGKAVLALSELEATQFLDDSRDLVRKYFAMEDPTQVDAVGVELKVAADLGDGEDAVHLRGIIDRLDRSPDGGLVVVDYKTGRSPRVGQEREKLAGVETYALLCERVLGVRPVAVRLLYLRDELVVERGISESGVRRQERRATAVWKAVERAHAAGSFRPAPSRLCAYCAFNDRCEGAAAGSRREVASVGSPVRVVDGA